MREYAKVAPQFWTGVTGKALKKRGHESVIVALYLMTSPHANMIGVYHCPVGYIAIDTGLTLEEASKGLQSAVEVGFCTFDDASDYVFVHEFATYQVGDVLEPADNRCKGIRNELAKLPRNLCRKAFHSKYGKAFHLPPDADKDSPSEGPSKALSSQKQEQEQKQEQAQKQDGRASATDQFGPAADAAATTDAGKGSKAQRGERLPSDWKLPKAWGDWALEEFSIWTADKVRLEGEKFRDHWVSKTGKDATKLDWLGTWRNWCRSSIAHQDDPKPGRAGATLTGDAEARRRAESDAEAMRLLGIQRRGDDGEVIDAAV